MGRGTSARQDQAHPLNWNDIKEFIETAGEGLRADRERAMLCVAYETLARRGEIVALEVRDIDILPDGTGQALIRRGQDGRGGAGESSVPLARDGEMGEGVDRALGDYGRGGISSADWQGSDRRIAECRKHRDYF